MRMLYVMTLTYIFKVTNFEMKISQNWWELAKNAQVWLYIGCYLPSNRNIAKAVLLNFQGNKFESLIFQKRWELSQKCVIWLLQRLIFVIEWHYRDYCITRWSWPSFFQGQTFSCYAFCIKNIQAASGCPRQIFLDSYGLHHCVAPVLVLIISF